MKIDWDQSVAGLTLVEIRDILRFVARPGMILDLSAVAHRLSPKRTDWSISIDEIEEGERQVQIRARRLVKCLAASGIIGMPGHETMLFASQTRHPGYDLTSSGYGLLRATKTKRITRRAADAAVTQLRAAIASINADPVLMYDVERVAVYGSYITDAADLGDVDVAYTLNRRWKSDDEHEAMRLAFEAVHEPPISHKALYDYQYCWDRLVVERMLRPKACIQLTDMHHVESLGCPMLEIHPTETMVPAKEGYLFDRPEIRLIEDGGKALAQLDRAIANEIDRRDREAKEKRLTILSDPKHEQYEITRCIEDFHQADA
jgi:hypothetical protein